MWTDSSTFETTKGFMGDKRFYTAGLNYFLNGRNHKIQINYINKMEELNKTFFGHNNENVILTQYQICF